MSLKVLITGASGMLGQDLVSVFEQDSRYALEAYSHAQLDVTDAQQVCTVLNEQKPDWIVHAAAYTAVDDAEKHAQDCRRVNVDAVRTVAQEAQKLGAKLCYFSSDYVFDGCGQKPYREEDPVDPLNVYGQSKLDGERALEESTEDFLTLRTSWLCGLYGPNFVKAILNKASQGEALRVVDDQLGSPTFTWDLAKLTKRLLEEQAQGLFHVSSEGQCSWYEFAREIIKLADLNNSLQAISSAEIQRPAKRPGYSVLSKEKLNQFCAGQAMPDWQESLNVYMNMKEKV